MGSCYITQGPQLGALSWPRGVGSGGREVQEGGDICLHTVAHSVKNPPAMQETWVRSPGWEDPLEKGKATHASILAWRIPLSQRVGHAWATYTSSMAYSSGHVWMWELDHKESWVLKNWCFWTVVLEKTLESPLGCKEIQPVHTKGGQSWVFIGRTDAEAEAPILWPPDAKNWFIWRSLVDL